MEKFDEVKQVLDNLGVLNLIYEAFNEHDIPISDENLYKAGFGFHKIKDTYGPKVIIEEEVMKNLKQLYAFQTQKQKEQTFALLGFVTSVDEETIFFINRYVEGDDSDSTIRSTSFSKTFTEQINNYINSSQIHNRLVLMGHTHPDLDNVQTNKEINYQENEVQKAIFDKDKNDSSFLLRKAGLNISVPDITHLIHFSNDVNGKSDVLIGTAILLPRMELNILFYANNTIQFCDDVASFDEDGIRPINNFLTSPNSRSFKIRL